MFDTIKWDVREGKKMDFGESIEREFSLTNSDEKRIELMCEMDFSNAGQLLNAFLTSQIRANEMFTVNGTLASDK